MKRKPVQTPTYPPVARLRIPANVRDALERYCRENQITLSALLLGAACREIGQPELLETVRTPGRPKAAR